MDQFNATVDDVDSNLNNNSNSTSDLGLGCPEISADDNKLMNDMSYWLEGVIQTVVAFGGILGNVASCYILSRREMRNSFNLLLVMLSAYDTFYLLFAILDSCRKFFENLTSDVHIILFPHFLYPLHHTALAGSIFMTVSIAFERYTAVRYPLDYNKAVNSPEAIRCRLLKYFIPVLIMSLVFNIPKFLECYVKWFPTNSTIIQSYNQTTNTTTNVMVKEWSPRIVIAPMRLNEYYSTYNTYSRLLVEGLIPLGLISFFNYSIFKDIRERQMRKANAANSLPNAKGNAALKTVKTVQPRQTIITNVNVENTNAHATKTCTLASSSATNGSFMTTNDICSATADGEAIPLKTILHSDQLKTVDKCNASKELLICPSTVNGIKEDAPKKSLCKNDISESTHETLSDIPNKTTAQQSPLVTLHCNDNGTEALINTSYIQPSEKSEDSADQNNIENGKGKTWSGIKRRLTMKAAVKVLKDHPNGRRKKNEDHLGVVFMGIISIFIVTNLPRVILDIHEAATIRIAQRCGEAGKDQFALWSMLCLSVAHFLLVLNSSLNVVIYCFTSSQFRTELVKIFDLFAYRMGFRKRRRHGLGGTRSGRI